MSEMRKEMQTWLKTECVDIANHIRYEADLGIPFAMDKLARAVRMLEDNPSLYVYISPTPEMHKEPDDMLSTEFMSWVNGAKYQLEDNLISVRKMAEEYAKLYGTDVNIQRIESAINDSLAALRDFNLLKAYNLCAAGEWAIDLTTYEAIAKCQCGKP